MARSFPTDVVVLDTESLILARFAHGKKNPQLLNARMHRMAEGTFAPGVVTPVVANENGIQDAIRRIRMEAGKLDQLSLLLPDSWFRINLLEVATLPENPEEAKEVVAWTLKRTLPIRPEDLRTSFEVISRDKGAVRVLVVSALEKTLAQLEAEFAKARISVVLIEPIGINIWNAMVARESLTSGDRIFLYARDREFTTAIFRGWTPIFVRSRSLNGERSFDQEIRLSASYIRSNIQPLNIETCYVAGNHVAPELPEVVEREFGAPVRRVPLAQFLEGNVGPELTNIEAELTACAGVFTS